MPLHPSHHQDHTNQGNTSL
ncbi:unnamed protein product [Lathyrus sativus]|nr:unnamed protein product [Lathyrus sativus]